MQELPCPSRWGSIDLGSLFRVCSLNLRAAVQVSQYFLKEMKRKQWGRIVNISSRAIFGARDRTSYSVTKSALIGCTRTWALELAAYGITVNAVAPGPIETELFRQKRPIASEAEKQILESISRINFYWPDWETRGNSVYNNIFVI